MNLSTTPKKGRGLLATLCLAAGIALAVCGCTGREPGAGSGSAPAEAEDTWQVQVGVSAEGWDAATSSPVIVHIVSEEEGVDYYHAYAANEKTALDVPSEGDYEVSFIAPINADGSTYRVPEDASATATNGDEGEAELPFAFERIEAADVTEEDLSAIASAVSDAVKAGDETLTGENGVKVVELVKANASASPNADTEAIEQKAEQAVESARSGESAASTGVSASGTGNGGSNSGSGLGSGSGGNGGGSTSGGGPSTGGNSNSGSGGGNTSASHSHNWVAQTSTVHHDAEYRTVHHDAEYRTVHHDAVTQERHICNGCNADITGNESAHIKANILNGCGGWHSSIVTIQQAYDEQVLVRAAYDERVLVRAAWDETVTTGYKCSTCGVTR